MGVGDGDPELAPNYLLDHAMDCLLSSVSGSCGTSPSHINAGMWNCEGVAPRWLMEEPLYPVVQLPGLKPAFIGLLVGLSAQPQWSSLLGGPPCRFRGIGMSVPPL